MIHIHAILAPTDFSSFADYALNYAAELAKGLNAKIHVLHVAEYSNAGGDPDANELLIPHVIPEWQKRDKERLEQITLRLRREGADAHLVFKTGRAYHEIVRTAGELNVDLVVLGTHGRTGFNHFFFGSTTEKVVRLCKCPVLTVKHSELSSMEAFRSADAEATTTVR